MVMVVVNGTNRPVGTYPYLHAGCFLVSAKQLWEKSFDQLRKIICWVWLVSFIICQEWSWNCKQAFVLARCRVPCLSVLTLKLFLLCCLFFCSTVTFQEGHHEEALQKFQHAVEVLGKQPGQSSLTVWRVGVLVHYSFTDNWSKFRNCRSHFLPNYNPTRTLTLLK